LAGALRLPDIRQPLIDAFSWRESSTAMMADNFRQRNWNVFYPEVNWAGPGQTYQGREFQVISYVTAVLQQIFGWHDWFGRLVAVGFGLWSIVAFYLLVREALGCERAWASALMLALLPGAAFVDRSFLPDPAMLALTLTGFWLLLVYLRSDKTWVLVLATSLTALGVMAKLPGIIMLGPMAYAIVSALRQRTLMKGGTLAALGFALASMLIPIIAYYGWAIYLGTNYPPFVVVGVGYVWEEPREFLKNVFYLRLLGAELVEWFLTIPVMILASVGLLTKERSSRSIKLPLLFESWLLSAMILYALAASEIVHNTWNLLIFAPPVAGLAGRALLRFVGKCNTRSHLHWAVIGRTVVIAALLLWSGHIALNHMKIPWSSQSWTMGHRLAELSAPDDLVITAANGIGDPVGIYYSRRRGWVWPPGGLCPPGGPLPDLDSMALQDDAESIKRLEALRGAGGLWFAIARGATDNRGRRMVEYNRDFLAYLEQVSSYSEQTSDYLIYKLRSVTPSLNDVKGECTGRRWFAWSR
jgi:hypothetical protein